MSAFISYLHEVFESLGTITSRKMFGGYGIYHDGLMFALVTNDTLYLKADAQSAGLFAAQGLPAFAFQKNGKMVQLSYYLAPEDMLEEREQAALWARRAFDAALRARKSKK